MFPDSRRPRRLAIVISAIDVRQIATRTRVEVGRDRDELLHRRRRRHRDRHHVVDQQGRRRDEAEQRRQLLAGDGVRAAAVGERPADLAVARSRRRRACTAIAAATWIVATNASAPPTTRTRRISSVA